MYGLKWHGETNRPDWCRVFDVRWWDYVLRGNAGLRNILCRIGGHRDGPTFYNFGYDACEPDWRCRECGEYLG